MKVEVDTLNDSVDEIKKTISLLQEVLEKRTGVTGAGIKAPLRPSEFKKEAPKIIYEDILDTPGRKAKTGFAPSSAASPSSSASFNDKAAPPVKKRKVLRQDEHVPEEEEEDVDRNLPKIQVRDYW